MMRIVSKVWNVSLILIGGIIEIDEDFGILDSKTVEENVEDDENEEVETFILVDEGVKAALFSAKRCCNLWMVDVRSEDLTGVELNGSDDDIDDEEEEEDSNEEDESVDGSLTFLILLKFVEVDLCSEAFVGLAYDGSGI
ncbi:unnamed protein product [[Candida] boidinii]|nr:unnamed protein product [[Candida] boidinii]